MANFTAQFGTMECVKEGYLKKNHAGHAYSKTNNRRWFTTEGFQVAYYKDIDKKSVKGHFDLRNVERIELLSDVQSQVKAADVQAAGAGAVRLTIGEEGKRKSKPMVISFKPSPEEREQWLRLWCSAILVENVAESLLQVRDDALAAALDAQYAATPAVSRKHSIFSSKPTTTTVLTPRNSISAAQVRAPSQSTTARGASAAGCREL